MNCCAVFPKDMLFLPARPQDMNDTQINKWCKFHLHISHFTFWHWSEFQNMKSHINKLQIFILVGWENRNPKTIPQNCMSCQIQPADSWEWNSGGKWGKLSTKTLSNWICRKFRVVGICMYFAFIKPLKCHPIQSLDIKNHSSANNQIHFWEENVSNIFLTHA